MTKAVAGPGPAAGPRPRPGGGTPRHRGRSRRTGPRTPRGRAGHRASRRWRARHRHGETKGARVQISPTRPFVSRCRSWTYRSVIMDNSGMETRRLQFLLELSRLGSMHAVADVLGTTTSTVSQQVAALAREIGTPLLEP